MKKTVDSEKFIEVIQRPFNVYILKFTDCEFYFMGGFKSYFKSSAEITNEIKTQLKPKLGKQEII